jgi:hypothetical protein
VSERGTWVEIVFPEAVEVGGERGEESVVVAAGVGPAVLFGLRRLQKLIISKFP